MKKLLIRVFTIGVSLVLGSLLWVYGQGAWLSSGIVDGTIKATEVTTLPKYLTTDAWVVLAHGQQDETALFSPEALAFKAQTQDLVSGRPTSFLLGRYLLMERLSEAAKVATLADKLWPIHIYSRSRLADYWLSLGKVDKYLHELNLLITRDPSLRQLFFPQIERLAIVEQPQLLTPFVTEPPAWWDDFIYFLNKSQDVDILERIIERRLEMEVPLSRVERDVMVSKLRRSGRWRDAFVLWSDGLEEKQRKLLVNGLYDGGFEEGRFNQAFGWVVREAKSLRITAQSTYGARERKALNVEFRQGSGRIKFFHLSQLVLLKSGRYILQLRYRLDTFRTTKGLVWRVRCVTQGNKLLAESEALVGRQPWKSLSLEFGVTSGCELQNISLEAASSYAHDHLFKGKVWFDDVKIVNIGHDNVK